MHGWRWRQPNGPLMLAGDAAGMINPLTGEGIYYAVATGVLAGRSAAAALRAGAPQSAGARYRSAASALLARHLRDTAAVARLARDPRAIRAGISAAHHQRFFDDLVELGLGPGPLTAPVLRGMASELLAHSLARVDRRLRGRPA